MKLIYMVILRRILKFHCQLYRFEVAVKRNLYLRFVYISRKVFRQNLNNVIFGFIFSKRCWTNLLLTDLILLDSSLFDELKTALRFSISFLKNVLMEKICLRFQLLYFFMTRTNTFIRNNINRSTGFICLRI